MASKSKRRRKVLGASCILAALIIAGSSFAWFTSKDEVTNRLSANADYGVSIVESFAPPKNWLPGQEVDKDVYATNTGNIGAFVEEDVKGTLTVTVEKNADAWDAGCVELTPAERYSVEAGSYLALAPVGSQKNPGDQVVAVDPANEAYTPGTSDFTPDVEGLYVFRRNIDVDKDTGVETFKYEGYYFNNNKYYKVKLTSVTPDDTVDYANDGVNTDGNLTAAAATYFKEETKVLDPTDLVYDADNNRLVATYNTGKTATVDLTTAATNYDTAINAYEYALEQYNAAARSKAASNSAASDAYNNMQVAQKELNDALSNQRSAADTLAQATAKKAQADAAKTAATNNYETTLADLNNNAQPALENANNALIGVDEDSKAAFLNDFNSWLNGKMAAGEIPIGTTIDTITYEDFIGFNASSLTYNYYELMAAKILAQREVDNLRTQLYGKKDGSETDYETSSLYGLKVDADNKADAAQADYDTASTAKNSADATVLLKETAFNNARDAYVLATGTSDTSDTNYDNAVIALANAVSNKIAAENAYNESVAVSASDGMLKININLSDNVVTAGGVADKWQLAPNPIVDNVAKFYYTSILEGGETSSKLVDSVKLDDSVTADMYKSFDFELNVALKSAQITYADDNETILPYAATQEIGRTPTLTNPTDINTALTW